MVITITEEHIQKGERESTCRCPIALALKDAGFDRVCVGDYQIFFKKPENKNFQNIYTSKAARRFIHKFDTGFLTVRPYTIELDTKEALINEKLAQNKNQ